MILSLVVSFLLGSNSHADRVKLLVDDGEALQARLDIISSAKHDIRAEYFYVGDDDISMGGLALLREEARKGRIVKVIVDAGFSKIKPATVLALTTDPASQGRFQIRFFNQFEIFNPLSFNNRDHDKQINVDGEVFITGGRNVGNDYFGFDKEHNFVDLDIMVYGGAAKNAYNYFDSLWEKKDNVSLPRFSKQNIDQSQINEASQHMTDILVQLRNGRYKAKIDSGISWYNLAHEQAGVRFVSDSPKFNVDSKHHDTADALYEMAMKRANKSLTILSPYLIMTPRALLVLNTLLKRGSHIKIITNSIYSTDAYQAQGAYRRYKEKLIAMGIELYEFNGPETTHAKTAVFENLDGTKVAWVGSYNLDNRSARLNREMGVFVDDVKDQTTANELVKIIESFQRRSLLVGRDGQKQNLDKQDKDLPLDKKIKLELQIELYRINPRLMDLA